jgi:hypothetical protein
MTPAEQEAVERYLFPERFEEEQSAARKSDDTLELVEQRLQQAQARKAYKDIGRKRGTAKERRALDIVRGGNLDDLEEDPETARKMVNKGKVWPEVNIQRERDMGSSSGCTYMKVKLHRALAANPFNSKAARKIYVEQLESWQTEWDALRTYDEIGEWCNLTFTDDSSIAYIPELQELPTGKSWRGTALFYDRLALVFGKVFINIVKSKSESGQGAWEEAFMFDAFTEAQEQEWRATYKINWENVRRQQDRVDRITQAETTNDLRMALGEDLWLRNPAQFRDISKKDMWLKTATNWLQNAQKDPLPDKYRARQEDWSWAFTTKEKQETTTTGKPRINTYPFLSRLQRKNGLEVTERENKVLTDKWGLKAVQYGNSLTDAESEKLTWHANMAFTDLRDLLGTDISVLHKKGELGLDFATRGNGGAAATYYSAYTVINLTKKWGDGALAHEWAHFFDNMMGARTATKDMVSINGSVGGFASTGQANDPIVSDVMRKIMKFIRHGNGTETQTRRFTAKNHRFYSHVVGIRHATIEMDVMDVYSRRADLREKKWRDRVVEHLLHLRGITEADVAVPLMSSYQWAESDKIGTAYWVKAPELFARAFEGYVMHVMEQRGMQSDFLQTSRKFYKEKYSVYPYPHNGDMDTLAPLFDELMGAARIAYGIPTWTAKADAPRVSIEVENTSLEGEEAPSIDQKQQENTEKRDDKQEAQRQKTMLLLARARAQRVRILALMNE